MSYKTILVHVDQSRHAAKRIALAAEVARAFDAHLVGAASSGFTREFYRNSSVMYAGPIPLPELDVLTKAAQQALQGYEEQVQAAGVTSYERRISDDETEVTLLQQARYADLVVLSQSDPSDDASKLLRGLPESITLNSGRPVLLVPYAGEFSNIGQRALVAWDGSRAATRAITDALPLLRRSSAVTLVVYNADQQAGVHGEQPGADMALYLARHGVKIEVMAQKTPAGLDVGNALLSLAADLGSDLIVMGGYGHMRWREMIMGGVTRTLLQTMTVPILMSH
ncbi:universal stress protein [Duganella qianjiadongensis]|uniref:Universal stress protein n=1 Tax=Duganella qianjiadongensis TaxID=2692176 RepID=A0ABW9VLK7_9BURK|nr:universal stress protein [Duganella qianjiadongensis]MYM39384.1 universal stress protein [Duganella qianjiadongensis]